MTCTTVPGAASESDWTGADLDNIDIERPTRPVDGTCGWPLSAFVALRSAGAGVYANQQLTFKELTDEAQLQADCSSGLFVTAVAGHADPSLVHQRRLKSR